MKDYIISSLIDEVCKRVFESETFLYYFDEEEYEIVNAYRRRPGYLFSFRGYLNDPVFYAIANIYVDIQKNKGMQTSLETDSIKEFFDHKYIDTLFLNCVYPYCWFVCQDFYFFVVKIICEDKFVIRNMGKSYHAQMQDPRQDELSYKLMKKVAEHIRNNQEEYERSIELAHRDKIY